VDGAGAIGPVVAVAEELGGKVRAVRPDDGTSFFVELRCCKYTEIAKGFKYLSIEFTGQVTSR